MNRRDALKSLLVLSGSAAVYGSDRFLTGTINSPNLSVETRFTPELLALAEEIAETIIPATADSGGAKAAKLGVFMQEIVSLYYSPEEQALFFAGLDRVQADAVARFQKDFVELAESERTAILMGYETGETPADYRALKQLTTWGYFSSEIGMTQARAFLPIPTRYEGDLPLKTGQKAWAY